MLAATQSPQLFSSTDLADARGELREAAEESLRAFAIRQCECRWRMRQLLDFYRKYPCRMAHLHRLTAMAVLLGRFWGHSAVFTAIGELFMPVNRDGQPATPHWSRYTEACDQHLPVE